MNAFDDNRIGTLLDYPDHVASIDLTAIVRAGHRRRHRRQAAVAGAGAVTLAATGGGFAEIANGSHSAPQVRTSVAIASSLDPSPTAVRTLPATVTQSDNLLADYPPAHGAPTTLVSHPDGWRAVAYVDTAGDLCFGSVTAIGDSTGACGKTDAFGDGPEVDNATGPNISAAATAPATEAPDANEIGVFGMVTTGATLPARYQRVARVVVTAGAAKVDATLSPSAADLGSTTPLAAASKVWFAWLPTNVEEGQYRLSSYTADGDFTGSQPLWLTPKGRAIRVQALQRLLAKRRRSAR